MVKTRHSSNRKAECAAYLGKNPAAMRFPGLFCIALCLAFCAACYQSAEQEAKTAHPPSEAGAAFQWWGLARTFPDGRFHTEKYAEALAQMQLAVQLRNDRDNTWSALGPKNIGGRTLCLAINPLDTNILWAGSASGGLWKSTSGGRGTAAWQRVETGFPLLGVAAIALDPSNPDVLYVGTGEVYNQGNTMPNVAVRTTRGTYGIGILKSTDGGLTWTKSLDWSYGDLRGVQDIKINPQRPATLYAATTEGLLRSYDAGASWQVAHALAMAVDIEIHPVDTARVFVTHGSFQNNDVSGLYRSTNGGQSFAKLTGGLPASYSGKALLGVSPSNPAVMYASIGNVTAQVGLYKTTTGGNSWTQVSTQNVCAYQGWYSHDVAVHPTDPEQIIWVGIDAWKSTDSGLNVEQKTYWYNWDFGQVPVGGPEGPSNYVHADIHRVYYASNDPNKVYCVSDGGIFVSPDAGESWQGRNGGYQTQQFYANFSNSTSNPDLALGGMQDNATAIYTGGPAWTRVIGGDGENTAIHPFDDNIMYASTQYLGMRKSVDGGGSFYGIASSEINNEDAAFNGPFEIAPSNPDILYAGAQSLWRSDDGGETWLNASGGFLADGDVILTLAIDPLNPDVVYCSTAPTATNLARVFKYDYGTATKTELTGLPNRLCMDIAISPANSLHLSGFNIQHVWRSLDGGLNWEASNDGLPDVPTNTLLIDPAAANNVYAGNDLGVWLSTNGGASWEPYSATAPQAMLVMHLSFSADHLLRVATHGLGVWQTQAALPSAAQEAGLGLDLQSIYPNPTVDAVTLQFHLPQAEKVTLRVMDAGGKTVLTLPAERLAAGVHTRSLSLARLPAGTYGLVLETGRGRVGKVVVRQ